MRCKAEGVRNSCRIALRWTYALVIYALVNPVPALQAASSDVELKWRVPRANGKVCVQLLRPQDKWVEVKSKSV
eukprot:5725494-Pleurochrysis_carterae.AAC.1